jgi:hypothetical protein
MSLERNLVPATVALKERSEKNSVISDLHPCSSLSKTVPYTVSSPKGIDFACFTGAVASQILYRTGPQYRYFAVPTGCNLDNLGPRYLHWTSLKRSMSRLRQSHGAWDSPGLNFILTIPHQATIPH